MKKRKVFLKDIIAQSPEKEYGQLYADIMLELSQGTLAPVRSAGTNGKNKKISWRSRQEVYLNMQMNRCQLHRRNRNKSDSRFRILKQ